MHYANWPMLITRRGSATLFAREVELPRHELCRRGELATGVLLASPIEHRRDHHYGAGERKES